MDIIKVSENSIRIKSKTAVFTVNPQKFDTKNTVDAVFFFDKEQSAGAKEFKDNGILVISGPGEYEIKGIKLTGVGTSATACYFGRIDSIDVFAAKASQLSKGKDVVQDCNIAIINADAVVAESSLAALNANVAVLYGQYAEESTKILGKQSAQAPKYSTTREKLPAELEVIILN